MSKITDLISPKVEVEFRGEKFMIESGFTLEATPAINLAFGQSDVPLRAEGLKQVLKIIAKKLYPDATDKEISKVDVKHTEDLLEVFFQLDKTAGEKRDKIKKTLETVKGSK